MHDAKAAIKSLIKSAGLFPLAAAAASFFLGTAIASYLAASIKWGHFWWGLLFVISMQLFTRWIGDAFIPPAVKDPSLADTPSNAARSAKTTRTFLYAAFISLAFMGTALSGFILSGGLHPISWLLLAVLILSTILYTVPPNYLRRAGIDEIWSAFLISGLVPAFSFSLMAGELHRLIPMSTTASAAFYLSALIIPELKMYAADFAAGRKTLVTRLDWKKAMFLHNAALEFGVFTLALAYMFGYPSRISISLLIVLPLIVTQIVLMNRIRQGVPPRFLAMQITSYAVYFLTLYFQFVGFVR